MRKIVDKCKILEFLADFVGVLGGGSLADGMFRAYSVRSQLDAGDSNLACQ